MSDDLRDHLGRRITTLRVSVTDRCNLRCRYCVPHGGVPLVPRRSLLRFEEIASVVRAAAGQGVTRVKLTGGEPLTRRGIDHLIEMLAGVDGIRDLSLTTNGTLLAGKAPRLRAAGLDRVTVSLDTLRPDRYRWITRGGDLAAVLAGLEAAADAGLGRLKVNVVVLGGINDDEIGAFARLSVERPIEVRFIELMRIGHRAETEPDRFLPIDAVRERLAPFGPLRPVARPANGGPAVRFRLPGAAGAIGLIAPISEPFCGTCNRLRLTSQGVLRACLLEGGEVPIKGLLRPCVDVKGLQAALQAAALAKPAVHSGGGAVLMSRVGG